MIYKIRNLFNAFCGRIQCMKRIGILVERQRAYGRNICCGIARFAQECGDWNLRFLEWSDVDHRKRLEPFDGFIVRILNGQIAQAFRDTGKPVVDVFYERDWPNISSVDQNARLVGELAANHFIEHKFTNFAFCGFNGRSYSDRRREAFMGYLNANCLSCSVYDSPPSDIANFEDRIIREERLSPGPSNRRLERWIKGLPKPIAVFCSHDLRAYQLMEACRRCGIRIPGEVAILGVDNDELICNFLTPTLSSIDLDGDLVGHTAAAVLRDRILSPDAPPCHVKVKPSRLVVGQSTQTYPISPTWLSDALVFIHSNVTRHLTAADVFAHVGKSHTLVSDAFRRKIGTTVQKEIQRSRLTEAMRLVRSSSMSFTEVAKLAGFGSAQYFCTSFTAAFGKPPSSFRKPPVQGTH